MSPMLTFNELMFRSNLETFFCSEFFSSSSALKASFHTDNSRSTSDSRARIASFSATVFRNNATRIKINSGSAPVGKHLYICAHQTVHLGDSPLELSLSSTLMLRKRFKKDFTKAGILIYCSPLPLPNARAFLYFS
jgi:hypothetical protein